MVAALLSDSRKSYSLNDLCGLNPSGTSFDTGKAGKALVKRLALKKRLNVSRLYHINELVRVIFHLIIGRTGAGAFAAAHTLADVDAAYAENFFFFIHLPASLVFLHAESLSEKLGEVVNGNAAVVLFEVVHTKRTGSYHHLSLKARCA